MTEKHAYRNKDLESGSQNSRTKEHRERHSDPDKSPASTPVSTLLQRAQQSPQNVSHGDLIAIQQTVGMRGMQRMLSDGSSQHPARTGPLQTSLQRTLTRRGFTIQPKLTVGAADDAYEREAEHVATRVMATSGSGAPVARKEEDNAAQRKAQDAPQITPLIQREAADVSGSFDAGQDIERRIASNNGGGGPLPAKLRAELEPRYGVDFSNVRVHTGAQSDELNRSLGAQAFTHGNHIYMGAGKYDPGTASGKHLLAHELTHVVQQGGSINRRVQRYPATALKSGSKLDWVKQTASVFRPGEGKSGGVYIFRGNKPLETIVVKPEYNADQGEGFEKSTEQDKLNTKSKTSLGTDILKATGIRTPDTRIVSEAEKGQIIEAAAKHNYDIPAVHLDPFTQDPSYLNFIRIMGKAEGTSISSATGEKDKNTDRVDVIRLINRLSDTRLMKEVGKMMAIDAFSKMGDRITDNGANLGNIMFAGNIATAIDNSSDFRMLKTITKNAVEGHFAQLLLVISNRAPLIENFLGSIGALITDDQARSAYNQYIASNNEVVQKWQQSLNQGMDEGIALLKTLLGNKKARGSMKKSLKGWSKQGATNSSYEAFKEAGKMLEMAEGGETDSVEMARRLKEYRAYREARAKRLFGFKWMTSKNKQRVQG